MSGTLLVIGTPIGNLGDLSPRAAEALGSADVCYAEDTRRTGRLLAEVDGAPPLRSLHEHNERSRVEEVLGRLERGERVALVTDAGMPTVSDPGRRVVEAARGAGFRIEPVPGPSAVTTAIAVSGFQADRFWFAGFAPRGGAERDAWVDRVRQSPDTVAIFESPARVGSLLADLAAAGMGDRGAVVTRELTKLHEEIRGGSISELATVYEGRSVKGEVTLVVEGAPEAAPPDPERVAATARRLAARGLSRKDIAGRLSEEYGLKRNDAYRMSLVAEEERDA